MSKFMELGSSFMVNPYMPKALFEILGICSKLKKKPTFSQVLSTLFGIVTIHIQIRHVRDHM